MQKFWQPLVHAICRPHRIEYKTADLVGGASGVFDSEGLVISRQDFVITNHRGQKLKCSFWQEESSSRPRTSVRRMPGVIYCHCNSGSRLDAAEAIFVLVPLGIRVFALDFSGSGSSEGDYVTLGANEADDLEALIQFIRAGGHTSTLALWGRSMGAVTALMYCERDPSVAGIVLDSPFSKLTDLIKELVEDQKIPLWRVVGPAALRLMRWSVKKKAGFDINKLSPVDYAPRSFTPALFGHGRNDSFVKMHHSERLHDAYAGDKEMLIFPDCDHNSMRPRRFYSKVRGFLARALHLHCDGDVHGESGIAHMETAAGQIYSAYPFSAPARQRRDESGGSAAAAAPAAEGAAAEDGGDAAKDTELELQEALAASMAASIAAHAHQKQEAKVASADGDGSSAAAAPSAEAQQVADVTEALQEALGDGEDLEADEQLMLEAAIQESLVLAGASKSVAGAEPEPPVATPTTAPVAGTDEPAQ